VSDPTETAESIGCTAFHATLFAVSYAALGDELLAAGGGTDPVSLPGRLDTQLVVRAIKDPTSIASGELMWDDVATTMTTETRDVILVRGITLAAAALAVNGTPNDWRWGRLHTLTLRSIFDSFGVPTYNDGPYAAPGGLFTVNVANPIARGVPDAGDGWDFAFAAGPSVRFVVELGPDVPRMSYQLPGGADLHRESPFYNNLLPNWLENQSIDFPFGPGAVPNPAVAITVHPGG
jgi:penicillin amidase